MGWAISKMMGAGEETAPMVNTNAEYTATIQYCGGWGYSASAKEIATKINAQYPNKFNIVMKKDQGMTGNLEVSVCKGSNGTAVVVHSKKNG